MQQPRPGDRVSEYLLIEPIGVGTFGSVFRARHHVWPDQLVAIKFPTDPGCLRALQREGAFMHRVAHASVVKPLGFDPYADPPYLVTEYVGGGDLRKLLADGPATIDRAVSIISDALAGLSAAHAAGVLHLDLKPSNILLTESGEAKLTDFGLGRALKLDDRSLIQSLSLSGDAASITGTLDYMAPEQRQGREVDARADLYSIGVVLFELLTGERPAGGERPSDLRAEVPSWLDRVFGLCYTRVQWRYESADQMLDDLRAAGRRGAPPPLPAVRPQPVADLHVMARAARPAASVAGALEMAAAVRRCPTCSGPIRPEDQFCIHCGMQLTETVRRCTHCGGFPQPQDRFCVSCGAAL
ncbi:MAG: Serine/threonine-protein kinase PknB [Phycisphaerae bacterium]|nr:Serine/threonine-protein kinase PknB [Phycisphaerae bacterium]